MVMYKYLVLVSSTYWLTFSKVVGDFDDPAQPLPMDMIYFAESA